MTSHFAHHLTRIDRRPLVTSTSTQQRPSRVAPYRPDHTARFLFAFFALLLFLGFAGMLIGYFA